MGVEVQVRIDGSTWLIIRYFICTKISTEVLQEVLTRR